MRFLVAVFLIIFSGCVPTYMDTLIAFGENQTVERQIRVSHREYIEDETEPPGDKPTTKPSSLF